MATGLWLEDAAGCPRQPRLEELDEGKVDEGKVLKGKVDEDDARKGKVCLKVSRCLDCAGLVSDFTCRLSHSSCRLLHSSE